MRTESVFEKGREREREMRKVKRDEKKCANMLRPRLPLVPRRFALFFSGHEIFVARSSTSPVPV